MGARVVVSDGVRDGEGFVTEEKLYRNRVDCGADDEEWVFAGVGNEDFPRKLMFSTLM